MADISAAVIGSATGVLIGICLEGTQQTIRKKGSRK